MVCPMKLQITGRDEADSTTPAAAEPPPGQGSTLSAALDGRPLPLS